MEGGLLEIVWKLAAATSRTEVSVLSDETPVNSLLQRSQQRCHARRYEPPHEALGDSSL